MTRAGDIGTADGARPLRAALAAALVIVALLLASYGLTPPAPKPATAPATAFSAGRAMAHVRSLAREPRPHGSAAGDAARDYLTGQLSALGYQVSVQRAVGVAVYPQRETAAAGPVENIVARLPGRDPKLPAVMVMAHYDSVDSAPGAGDDAAGTAAALEIARAIRAGPAPIRDVMILLTDGEESGLLGARAYFADGQRVARVDAVLNLEARGSGGRPTMFQAGPKSGGLVKLLLDSAPDPFALSPAAAVYEALPNDTDLTPAIEAGVRGLNFAFTGREFDYHSPTDSIANLDPRSVQAMGDMALPVVRRLADSVALPPDTGVQVYGQIPRVGGIAYPAAWGWLLLIGAALTLGAAAYAGRVRRPAVLRGLGQGLWVLSTAGAALPTVRRLTGVPDVYGANKPLLAGFGAYELALALTAAGVGALALHFAARGQSRIMAAVVSGAVAALALAAGFDWRSAGLAASAAALALAVFGGPGEPLGAWIGMIALALLFALAAQIAAPAASSVILWAAAPAALAALVVAVLGWGRPLAWIAAALIAALPLAYTLTVAHMTAEGLSALYPQVLALFLLAAALLLAPLFMAAPRRAAVAGGVALGAGVLLAVSWPLLHRPSARHPVLAQVNYWVDPDARSALRIAPLPRLDEWTERALRGDGGTPARAPLPEFGGDPVWQAPAKLVAVPRPVVTLAREGPRRALIVDGRGARVLRLRLDSRAGWRDVRLNGAPAPGLLSEPGIWRVRVTGATGPISLSFVPAGPGSLGVDALAVHDSWPLDAVQLRPRPPQVAPWLASDKTMVVARARFGL